MPQRDLPETLGERLFQVLDQHGIRPLDLTPLAGDVSLRSYFRLRLEDGRSTILVTYPAELAGSCARFARTSELLAAAGVRVPEIQLKRCEDGLMLVEDLGERTLYDLRSLGWSALLPYLRTAVKMIAAIRSIPGGAIPESSPPLDIELLGSELRSGLELLTGADGLVPGSMPPLLRDALEEMVALLAATPPVPCHRDFMARNLVPVDEAPGLAVIDHQDLRLGPPTYDLASLLNDSLYPPPELETELVAASLRESDQLLDYHRAAGQRTLKAVGTFLAFARRGHERHRVLVRPTLARARYHLSKLPEMEAVQIEIDRLWRTLEESGQTT